MNSGCVGARGEGREFRIASVFFVTSGVSAANIIAPFGSCFCSFVHRA